MKESISATELDDLAMNHRSNNNLPFLTNVTFVKLDQLQDFIAEAKSKHPDFDTVQINFIRYRLSADQTTILHAGRNLSQVSLMLIPAKTIDSGGWLVEVQKDENQNVFTLSIEKPGTNDASNTGLCPPRGDCPPTENIQ